MKTNKDSPIGMFDSGVGGLSVLRVLRKQLPKEKILFFGDTAHLPYGEKTPGELAGYGRRIAAFLKSQGVKIVLIACNTATVHSLQAVQEEMGETPVLGIIEAGAEAAARAEGRVGIIATRATTESQAYPAAIEKIRPGAQLVSLAAPYLVTLVEEGDIHSPHARRIVRQSLEPFAENPPENLLLGCTHFPGLTDLLQETLPGVRLIDPAHAMVEKVSAYLKKENLLREEGDGSVHYVVSGNPYLFASSGALLLGEEIRDVAQLTL